MRNILITAMMLIVVALMFMNIVADDDGLKVQIESHGTNAIEEIEALTAGE